MNSMVFKYKHHYQQQQQHSNNNRSQKSSTNNCHISSPNNNNNNNQNSIFILNTAANNILPNNHQLYYSDLNENNGVSSSATTATSLAAPPASVWSSASATMCSPAAHALQKLFNCSSSSSYKSNHGYNNGIESKTFKSKAEILKKKSKFWKYLEDEDNDKNNQKGIEGAQISDKQLPAQGFKFKSSHCSQSAEEPEDHSQEDLADLLDYSCSLCDNCRCVDCQIGYFDCENSEDSNSEYSFHLSAYEEDEDEDADTSDNDNVPERQVDLTAATAADCRWPTPFTNCCTGSSDGKQQPATEKCCTACCGIGKQQNCTDTKCCQQCFMAAADAASPDQANRPFCITTARDH